jgi:hypothetical protein
MLGAVIAQLFRLQNSPSPNGTVSLYVLAIPLACICQGAALITALTGGHRYWRLQNAMAQGQALASGWEFWLMIGLSGSVSDPHLSSYEFILGRILLTMKKGPPHPLCRCNCARLNVTVGTTRSALLLLHDIR